MNYIFDFDGTLMDTAPVILSTMRATIEELGLPERTEQECRATIGLRLEEIPAALFPEHSDVSEEYAATYASWFASSRPTKSSTASAPSKNPSTAPKSSASASNKFPARRKDRKHGHNAVHRMEWYRKDVMENICYDFFFGK